MKLILENEFGEKVCFTNSANEYMASDIDGLDPPASTISTSPYISTNGSNVNRSFVEKRNIVISFQMRGVGIEKRRKNLYRVVCTSKNIKIYYRTKNVDVYTTGYVETFEIDRFSNAVSGKISILCPDPYFYATSENKAAYTSIASLFHFPFAIDKNGVPLGEYISSRYVHLKNSGEKTGMTIRISGIGKETETTERLTIYNANTGAYMRLDAPIASGDIILITTHVGRKKCTLIRNGVETNYIGNLVLSEWLCVENGDNAFYISTKSGENNVQVEFSFTEAYLGV